MKDILFKKHYDQIFEIDMGADTAKDNKRFDTAVACANTTKEIAKGFAEWTNGNLWTQVNLKEGRRGDWYNISTDEPKNGFYTTEELLEKYLETLNQK